MHPTRYNRIKDRYISTGNKDHTQGSEKVSHLYKNEIITEHDLERIYKLKLGESVTYSENSIGGGTLHQITLKRHTAQGM